MQHEPRNTHRGFQLRRIDLVAQQRMADGEHVDADLVFPMHMWRDYSLIGAYKKKSKNLRFTERIVDITGENQEFDCIC